MLSFLTPGLQHKIWEFKLALNKEKSLPHPEVTGGWSRSEQAGGLGWPVQVPNRLDDLRQVTSPF